MKRPHARCPLLVVCMAAVACGAPVQHHIEQAETPHPTTIALSRGPWAYGYTQSGRLPGTFMVVRDVDDEPALARALVGRMLAFPRPIRLRHARTWFALGDMTGGECEAEFGAGPHRVRCESWETTEGETVKRAGNFDERLGAYTSATYEVFDGTGVATQPPIRITLDREATRDAQVAQRTMDQAATDAAETFDAFVRSDGAASELRLFATLDSEDGEELDLDQERARTRLATFHRSAHPSEVPQHGHRETSGSSTLPSLDDARNAIALDDFAPAWRYVYSVDDPRPLLNALVERFGVLGGGLDLTPYHGHLPPRSILPSHPSQSDHLESLIYLLQRVTFRAHGGDERGWRGFADAYGTEEYIEWAIRGTDPTASAYIREAAIRYLFRNGDDQALAALSSLLADADLSIRLGAAAALAQRGRAESAPVLVRLLRSRDSRIFEGALEALGHLRDTTMGLAQAPDATEELMAIARLEVWAERLQSPSEAP